MLLLLLVMPVALLVMICVLERYERLIDRPLRGRDTEGSSSAITQPAAALANDRAVELGSDLAPEAA